MISPDELRRERELPSQQAVMQKLFVSGHLLRGADISAAHIVEFLYGLGQVCGMNIFFGPEVKSPDAYDKQTFLRLGSRPPEDVNGTVMWDDSGAQLYIFPFKNNWLTLDIYTCKEFDASAALQYIYEQLGVREDMRYSTSTATDITHWQQFTLHDGKSLNPEQSAVRALDRLLFIDPAEPSAVVAGRSLERIVARAIGKGYGERVAASYLSEEIARFQALHSAYEIATDDRFMHDVLSGRATSPDEYPFQQTYDRLASMEASAAQLQPGSRVIHIGTGWPGTAIGLYRQFGIPVMCVEKDPEVAQRSEDALRKLGLYGQDKLSVICADGRDINPERYGAVIVSAMVPEEDKRAIVWNMHELAGEKASGPLLILRTPPDRARMLLYPGLSRDATKLPMLEQVAATAPGPADPLQSLVYLVEETSAIRRGEDRRVLAAVNRLLPAGYGSAA